MFVIDQPTLPGFDVPITLAGFHTPLVQSRTGVGTLGELTAKQLFAESGYYAARARRRRAGDLVVIDRATGEAHRVEVKTARRCSDGKWRFTLWKKGSTDHRDSDYVLLLAVLADGAVIPFLVPVAVLRDQRQAVITSEPTAYNGKLAPYRQRSQLSINSEPGRSTRPGSKGI